MNLFGDPKPNALMMDMLRAIFAARRISYSFSTPSSAAITELIVNFKVVVARPYYVLGKKQD